MSFEVGSLSNLSVEGCVHTGGLESANSLAALIWSRKSQVYEYVVNNVPLITYIKCRLPEQNIRSALVALDYNHGVGREQAVDQEGNPRYKLNVSLTQVFV